MTRRTDNDQIIVMVEQIFNRIVSAEKNMDAFANYCEEDKDYNAEYKPQKNNFIDPITVNYIDYYTNYVKCVCFEYKNISFDLKIYTKNFEDLSSYIQLIKLGVICCLIDKNGYKEKMSLKIDLYLTSLQKKLPELPCSKIKKEHSRSGYSKFDDSIYICIYRREEWFKSFVQEMFFAFTVDLDGDKIMYKNILCNNFSIDDAFQINNSLIEFCARSFNCAVFLYFAKNIKTLPQFKLSFKKMLTKEKLFSVSQSHKLLTHFGLKYQDILYKPQRDESIDVTKSTRINDAFKDESGALCHYLIPSLLFIHQTRIVQWINFTQNNFFNIKKSERELVIFAHYISHCSKDSKTVQMFETKQNQNKEDIDISNNNLSTHIKFCYHRI